MQQKKSWRCRLENKKAADVQRTARRAVGRPKRATGETFGVLRLDRLVCDPCRGWHVAVRSVSPNGAHLVGMKGVLSHVELKSPYRVGRYGVDVDGFEAYLSSLDLNTTGTRVVILDEIGKMECLSPKFRFLIATIALKGTGFIETIKRRDDVELFRLRPDNRDSLGQTILRHITTWDPKRDMLL